MLVRRKVNVRAKMNRGQVIHRAKASIIFRRSSFEDIGLRFWLFIAIHLALYVSSTSRMTMRTYSAMNTTSMISSIIAVADPRPKSNKRKLNS